MLFGEYEIVEEFLSFLCKSCFASFSFAHRIIWFLKSSIGNDPLFNDKIRTIFHIIQTIFKSNNDKSILDSLFLSGSRDYLDYYNSLALIKDYFTEMPLLLDTDCELNEGRTSFNLSKQKFRGLLNDYIENEYIIELEKNVSNDNRVTDKKENQHKVLELNPNEIYLSLFTQYDYVTNDENNISTHCVKQIDLEDINLSSFLSSIHFIDQLCNISDRLMYVNPSEQRKTLLNELKKVNKTLPANVYLPFMNNSMRNYIISSIPLLEAKIYKTKQRAPYKITVECFKLDELTYYLKRKNKEKEKEKVNVKDTQSVYTLKEDKCHEMTNLNNGSNYNERITQKRNSAKDKYRRVMKINTNSNNETTQNKDLIDYKALMSYLNANEVKYSKPIIIRDVIKETEIKESKNKTTESIFMKRKTLDIKTGKEYNKLREQENESSIATDQKECNNSDFLVKLNNNIQQVKGIKQINTTILKNLYRSNSINLNISTSANENKKKLINPQAFFSNRTPKMKSLNLSFSTPMSLNNSGSDYKSDEEKEGNNSSISAKEEVNSKEEKKVNIFGETIEQKTKRLSQTSPFGKLVSYKLFDIIVKSGEDLRQEQFATQLINEFYQIFKLSKVKCWLQPYEIIATGHNVGIVEVVPNALSIDQLKRKHKLMSSLNEIYLYCFGPVNSSRYKQAMKNYIQSLAGYSLVCYFLQIKDRHNANILIDDKGHLIHIDFGFMLSNAPGKGLKFEKAPFKLTQDFVDVMGGINSQYFDKFRKLLWKGFIASVEHYEKIMTLIEMMYCGHGNSLECFINGQETIDELKKRFIPNQNMKKRDYLEHVDMLISQSLGNWRTKWYDKYQYYVQGILS